MEWFKFYPKDLKTPALAGPDDAVIGAWVRLIAACYDMENSGRFERSLQHSSRQWMSIAGVERKAVDRVVAAGLAAWDGDSLCLHGYDLEAQMKATERSRQNRELARRRWGTAKGTAEGNAKGTAKGTAEGNAEGEEEGEEEKRTDPCPAGGPPGPGDVGETPALELVPDEPSTRRAGKPDDLTNVLRVIEHYRKHHPRSFPKPNAKAKEAVAIAARLRDGRTVEELCQCIDGYHLSPHHLGHNDRNTKYLSLELFMRDESHVAAGIAFALNPPKAGARDPRYGRARIEDTDWSTIRTGCHDLTTGRPVPRRDPRIGSCRADEQDHSVTGDIDLDTGLPATPRKPATAVVPAAAKDPDRYRQEAAADTEAAVAAGAVYDLIRGLAVAKGAQ